MKLLRRLPLVTTVLAIGLFTGCAKHDGRSSGQSGGHVHAAPHGGKLIPLGEHAHNLELVRDATGGKLTLYVLDGHAENFVRIRAPSVVAIANVGGEKRRLAFNAVANTATGETVGDSAQFDGEAEWLKSTPTFEVVIPQLEIRGRVYADVELRLP